MSNMRSIALKLPYKLRERWCSKAYELQEECSCRVRILDLVGFTEKQARIAADPVFGNLQHQSIVKGKVAVKARFPVKLQSSSSSSATGVAIAPKEKQSEPCCPLCSCKHTLELCKPFMEETHTI